MLPTVVASEVQRALLDYLRTTFRLQDKQLEEALFRFLEDEQTGMRRGLGAGMCWVSIRPTQ